MIFYIEITTKLGASIKVKSNMPELSKLSEYLNNMMQKDFTFAENCAIVKCPPGQESP